MIAKGGYCSYGQDLGILMLDTTFPRLPGDIGNAKSFPFPVRYKRILGASPKRVVEEADPSLLEPFIAAARALEAEGVRAITTSCGFLALFQQELAASVNVPLFSSSLLQIPLLYEIFGRRGKVGVLTARSASLTELHFRNCGVQGIPLAVAGMDEQPEFTRVFLDKSEPGMEPRLDVERAEEELKNVAAALAAAEPEMRFIVLECTNMPPFKKAIQEASGKPVFDIISLAGFLHSGLLGS